MSLTNESGTVARATQVQQYDYTLCWRPEDHYVAGTQIELRSRGLRAFSSWRYVRMEVDGADVTSRWKINPSVSERWANPQRVILRATLPYGVRRGEAVRIRLTLIPPIWAGIDELLSIWTIGVQNKFQAEAPAPEPQREEGSTCHLPVIAGPVERLALYARPMPGQDGAVRTVIVPQDRFGNPGAFAQPVPVQCTWNGRTWEEAIQGRTRLALEPPAGVGRLTVLVPMDRLALDENIQNGVREGAGLRVTGNPVWAEGPDGLRPAFGEFHWHTDFSGDGQRPIEDALEAARDDLNMDFAAPGDHNTQGERWQRTVEALEAFNAPGDFATFFGWENSTNQGHENYYFTAPDHPLVCGGSAGIRSGALRQLHETLEQYTDFLTIPHHTNSVAETRKLEDDTPYWHPYSWMAPSPHLRLVEIMQTRGNQERNVYSDRWRGWHQGNGASVQDALALGHRLGFVGGTDNHCGWPGRAFAECEGKGLHPPDSVILTGLWTPRVERQAVFDALRARHTWAVWDTRALVHFTVNGALAGEEITVAPGTPLQARIRLSAEDALQSIELVSEGRVVWADAPSALDLDLEVPLGTAAATTHVYLRAVQRNGGLIYASPVFVDVAE